MQAEDRANGPKLNTHEERACELLARALGVPSANLRMAVHELVLASRGAVDCFGLDRSPNGRRNGHDGE